MRVLFVVVVVVEVAVRESSEACLVMLLFLLGKSSRTCLLFRRIFLSISRDTSQSPAELSYSQEA